MAKSGSSKHDPGNSGSGSGLVATRLPKTTSGRVRKPTSGRVKTFRSVCMRAPSTGGVRHDPAQDHDSESESQPEEPIVPPPTPTPQRPRARRIRFIYTSEGPHPPAHVIRWAGIWASYMELSRLATRWEQLPWPVQGHKIEDVQRETVLEFYRNCERPGQAYIVVMQNESARWRLDRLVGRWGLVSKDVESKLAVVAEAINDYVQQLTGWIPVC